VITTTWVPVQISAAAIASDPALANMQCWDFRITTDRDWGAAGLRATTSFGAFLRARAGVQPDQAEPRTFPRLSRAGIHHVRHRAGR
jgi:hypothetical protein